MTDNKRASQSRDRELCDLIQSIDEWATDSPECRDGLEVAISSLESIRHIVQLEGDR